MAYDAARQEVILFGPTAIEGGASETWTWKNGRWTQLHPATSPPPRTWAGIAYDAAAQTIVLFGGQSSIPGPDRGLAPMQDTWTWDGNTWASVHPSTGPPTAVGALLAYDEALGRVIMILDAPAGESQTWSWDGRAWTQLHPSTIPPTPRFGGVMAYDAARRQIVLFGQIVYTLGPQVGQTDTATWTFDGTTWTAHPSTVHPRGLEFAAMAYDDGTSTVVHFGGGKARDSFNDTWTWNGASWSQVSPSTSPWIRREPVAAYDAADRQVLIYGGGVHTQSSGTTYYDTWTWDGSTWTLRQPSASATSPDQLHAMIAAAGSHVAGQPASTGTMGIDAGYLSFPSHPAQGPVGVCQVYVAHDFPDTWRYVGSACADRSGVFPVVGQRDQVKASGCANVRDAPDFGTVLACLPNGTQVTVDDGPFYVNGKLWWHIQGRGFMAHDLLIS